LCLFYRGFWDCPPFPLGSAKNFNDLRYAKPFCFRLGKRWVSGPFCFSEIQSPPYPVWCFCQGTRRDPEPRMRHPNRRDIAQPAIHPDRRNSPGGGGTPIKKRRSATSAASSHLADLRDRETADLGGRVARAHIGYCGQRFLTPGRWDRFLFSRGHVAGAAVARAHQPPGFDIRSCESF
jgi:hypothetical protein